MATKPYMRISSLTAALAILLVGQASTATTPIYLGFAEMTDRAELVIDGTVTKLRVFTKVSPSRRSASSRKTLAPVAGPPSDGSAAQADPVAEPEAGVAGSSSELDSSSAGVVSSTAAPVAVGVEGGAMIFTEVTMRISDVIVGKVGKKMKFTIAGGTSDGRTVTVDAMPSFEVGERYILFLSSDYKTSAAPIMGVNEGYFHIVAPEASGPDVMLDSVSDIVLGVEENRVVVRRNPDRGGPTQMSLTDPPVPGPNVPRPPTISLDAQRYWTSTEPSVTPTGFAEMIRRARKNSR